MEFLVGVKQGTRSKDEVGTYTPQPKEEPKDIFHDLMDLVGNLGVGVATTPASPPKIHIPSPIEQWANDMISSSQTPWNEAKILEFSAMDKGVPSGKWTPRNEVMKILKEKGVCLCSDADIAKPFHFHVHYTSWCNWKDCQHDERIVAEGGTWKTLACTPIFYPDGRKQGVMDNDQRIKKHQLETATISPEPLPF